MIHKTQSEIIGSIIDSISSNYRLVSKKDIKPDSLLSVMIESIAIEISRLYDDIDKLESQNRVSTANKTYLDLIGNSIGAYRKAGQTDEAYRYDIVNSLRNSRTSSKSAIESAIQDVNGIYTYTIENNAYGAGSFAIHVQTRDNVATDAAIAELKSAIDKVVAEGIYYKIIHPKEIPISIAITLIGNGITSYDKSLAVNAIRKYITSIKSGATMYKNNIESVAIDASKNITSVYINSIKIDGKTTYGSEIKLLKDEQFRIDNDSIVFQ